MIESVANTIERLITDFSWKRAIIYLVSAAAVFGGFALYELYTDSFRLARLQNAAEVLVTLSSLEGLEHVQIRNVASSILDELNLIIGTPEIQDEVTSRALSQAIFSAAPWLIFLVFFLISEFREKSDDWADGLGGTLIIIFFAVLIGYGVDTSSSNWYRFGVPQIANAIILTLVYLAGRKDGDEVDGKEHNKQDQADA